MKQEKKQTTLKIRVKKSLDKYANEVLFPEKLAKANELIKGVKLP